MRIAVFGVGGAGGYFGGRLAQAGEDVVFIARGEHLQVLRTHGLRVDSVKGNFVLQSVQATDDLWLYLHNIIAVMHLSHNIYVI